MIEAKCIHAGQYRPYGDTYREWEIATTQDETVEEIVEWCFKNLYKRRVPSMQEWQAQAGYGGPRHYDLAYYFAGYYTIEETKTGRRFRFTICEPYTD